MDGEQLFYTPQELKPIMHLSMPTIYSLISQGEIPALRYGRKLLIPRAAFLKKLEAAGSPKES